jgi:hypothetical protein
MQDYLYIPKMKVKGYMYPQMKKPVGMLWRKPECLGENH